MLDGQKWTESRQKILRNLPVVVFESCFFMVEMDSEPSKTYREPKIFNFDIYNLDLQKLLPDFLKILPKFP